MSSCRASWSAAKPCAASRAPPTPGTAAPTSAPSVPWRRPSSKACIEPLQAGRPGGALCPRAPGSESPLQAVPARLHLPTPRPHGRGVWFGGAVTIQRTRGNHGAETADEADVRRFLKPHPYTKPNHLRSSASSVVPTRVCGGTLTVPATRRAGRGSRARGSSGRKRAA